MGSETFVWKNENSWRDSDNEGERVKIPLTWHEPLDRLVLKTLLPMSAAEDHRRAEMIGREIIGARVAHSHMHVDKGSVISVDFGLYARLAINDQSLSYWHSHA